MIVLLQAIVQNSVDSDVIKPIVLEQRDSQQRATLLPFSFAKEINLLG